MKITFTLLRCVLPCLVLSVLSMQAAAQDDLDKLMQNRASAEGNITGYIGPFMKTISLGMNQGWYNTAKPHKIAGFDLTITTSVLSVPDKELFYTPVQAGNYRLAQTSPDYPQAPTVFGPNRAPVYQHINDPSDTFEGPPGIDLKGNIGRNAMIVPMATLGFGLPKGTDIKIRFIPAINFDGGRFTTFGLGVMHDIKQWVPGLKYMPFDLSGFAGFTRIGLNYKFEDDLIPGENQEARFSIYSTTIQGLISKKFSVVTFYGGLGYNIATSNLAMKGFYDYNENNVRDADEVDPLSLSFSASGPRATAGMRLKLGFLTLHGDYTLQKYNTLTVGLGINVR